MYSKLKFYLGLSVINLGIIKEYMYLRKTNNLSLAKLKDIQNNKLIKLINYSYEYIPYYRKLFDRLNLTPSDFITIEDLEKLPILTKNDVIKNIGDFYSLNSNLTKYSNVSTGGSTGEPLKYRMSKHNSDSGFAILIRGWELGGYSVGDKVAFLAGGSLIGKKIPLKRRIVDYIMNFRRYSSYGMSDELLNKYALDMISWKPRFIRGYASAIFLFAEYVKKNNLQKSFNIKGVFSTSEMLFDNQRDFISKVFNCEVFDTYGLNDGAISAFECKKHNGMHIDMERGVFEIVNKDGSQIKDGETGHIIATTLNEYVMPLIRYDTGDIGTFSQKVCECSINRPLLKKLKGRVTDILKFNSIVISSPIITVLMGQINALQYQFIQVSQNKLIIKIKKGESYSVKDEILIKRSLLSQVENLEIDFQYVEEFSLKEGEKHKFIINRVNND